MKELWRCRVEKARFLAGTKRRDFRKGFEFEFEFFVKADRNAIRHIQQPPTPKRKSFIGKNQHLPQPSVFLNARYLN